MREVKQKPLKARDVQPDYEANLNRAIRDAEAIWQVSPTPTVNYTSTNLPATYYSANETLLGQTFGGGSAT